MSLHRGALETLGRHNLSPSALETFDVYDKAALDIGKSVGEDTKSYFDQMHEMMTKSGHSLVDYESGDKDMTGHSLGGRAPEDLTTERARQGTRASYQHPETGDVRTVRDDFGRDDFAVIHHDKEGWEGVVARKAQAAEDKTLHPTLRPDRFKQSMNQQRLAQDLQRQKDIGSQEALAHKDPYGENGPASEGYRKMKAAYDEDKAERRSKYTPEIERKYQDQIEAVSRETARAKAAGDTKNYEAGKAKYKEIADDHKATYNVKSIPVRESGDFSKLTEEEREFAYKQIDEDNSLAPHLSGEGNERPMAAHLSGRDRPYPPATPSAVESAVESATKNAPATQPAAPQPAATSQPAAAPEKTRNRAQRKALEAQQKRAAAAAQPAAPPPSAVQSAVESATENAPEARPQAAAAALEPAAAPQEAKLAQGAEEVAQAASTGAPIPQPVSVEKQLLEIRRDTQQEVDQRVQNWDNRTTNHPDWESATDDQKRYMGRQAHLSEIDDYEARGQKHPLLYTDDDWSELHGKEPEAATAHYAEADNWARQNAPRAENELRLRQGQREMEEQARNQPNASSVDDVLDPGFDDGGSSQRTAGSAAEAVDDASTAAPDGSTAAPKAGATASKGAKITTGAEAARTGANGMRTGSDSIASKMAGGRGRRFNMDIVDRQLDLTTRGLAGSLSSVINDYGLNRRQAVGGGYMDTLGGKAIRTGGKRVAWSSAEYAAPVFNAAEKEAKWATFATAEEAAESWADEIEGRAAQGGPVNKLRHMFYKAAGGRGSGVNKMMAKVGGFGTVLPVATNVVGIGMGMREGYREGGAGGAMVGGAKGVVSSAVTGQMIGASLAHPLLMLGGASLMMASYKVGHGIFDVRTRGNNYLKMGRAGGLSWNTGSTPGMDSQIASTMRGRALMSMENSRFNAMKSLGNESYMMTSPSARYGNSTQIGSQQPMLAY